MRWNSGKARFQTEWDSGSESHHCNLPSKAPRSVHEPSEAGASVTSPVRRRWNSDGRAVYRLADLGTCSAPYGPVATREELPAPPCSASSTATEPLRAEWGMLAGWLLPPLNQGLHRSTGQRLRPDREAESAGKAPKVGEYRTEAAKAMRMGLVPARYPPSASILQGGYESGRSRRADGASPTVDNLLGVDSSGRPATFTKRVSL
jgi:hypothetical protein